MPVDEVKIPNILWLLFAIPLWLMAFVIGNETAESRKQIELEKSSRKQIEMEKSLEYNDVSTYSSHDFSKDEIKFGAME